MIGLAAGLAQRGFRPFCYTIATFALLRPYEFVRCDLAYQDLPVTVVGMGAGLSYSTLGGTHQAVEDVAVAMACPNLTVLAPCDPAETAECTRWCAGRENGGPVYMRIGKAGERALPCEGALNLDWPRFVYNPRHSKTLVLSYGPIASEARVVAKVFGADLAHIVRLSPMVGGFASMLRGFDRVVVIEETVGAPLAAQVRAAGCSEVRSFALPREFGHTHGTREELLDYYGLTAEKIITQL